MRYGAKTVPVGGWYSMPRTYVDGGLIIGDSASLLNSQRLKGIHMAHQEGNARRRNDLRGAARGRRLVQERSRAFPRKVEQSWIAKELRGVRNFHQGVSARSVDWPGARGECNSSPADAGSSIRCTRPLVITEYHKLNGAGPAPPRFKGDGKLTFDRLTDVYHSGTRHEEDQPCHLLVADTNICVGRCVTEYGNPCQYFCPAAVYEMVEEKGARRLKINASNCVHCKTCDIADPYQIITWVPPEGGGGPNYEGM